MVLPQDCGCRSSVSGHTGFFTLPQPVGIPEASHSTDSVLNHQRHDYGVEIWFPKGITDVTMPG